MARRTIQVSHIHSSLQDNYDANFLEAISQNLKNNGVVPSRKHGFIKDKCSGLGGTHPHIQIHEMKLSLLEVKEAVFIAYHNLQSHIYIKQVFTAIHKLEVI